MKNLLLAACMCLMLIVGLKDGRMAKFDGYPAIKFDCVPVDGKPIPCIFIIVGDKVYPIPVEIIDGILFIQDDKAM